MEVIYDPKNPQFRKDAVEMYINNLRSISAIANKRGIRTNHILQPTLATELLRRGKGVKQMGKARSLRVADTKKFISAFSRFFVESRVKFKAEATSKANDRFDAWLDYTRFFSDVEDLTAVYYDHVHYVDHMTKELGKALSLDVMAILNVND